MPESGIVRMSAKHDGLRACKGIGVVDRAEFTVQLANLCFGAEGMIERKDLPRELPS